MRVREIVYAVNVKWGDLLEEYLEVAMELPKDLRNSLIAKIHIAKKQLGLDEEAYRSLLKRVGGKDSARDLDASGLKLVMDEMVRLGFRVGEARGKKLSPVTRGKGSKTQVDKIRALWIQAAQVGVVRNRYERGLNGFAKKMFKVERVEWLTGVQAQKCIEALKAMVERGSAVAQPTAAKTEEEKIGKESGSV